MQSREQKERSRRGANAADQVEINLLKHWILWAMHPWAAPVEIDKAWQETKAWAHHTASCMLKDWRRLDPDDAVQEFLLKLETVAFARYDGVRPIRFYLYRVLANVCFGDERQPFVRHTRNVDRDVLDDRDNPVMEACRREKVEFVRTKVDQLSNPLREAIQDEYFDGLSVQVSAERRGTSPGAMLSRRHRAKKRLLPELREVAGLDE